MLNSDYPIDLLCSLLGVARSSFYYQPVEADEGELREAINQLAAQFPTYGSRRLAAQICDEPTSSRVPRRWRTRSRSMSTTLSPAAVLSNKTCSGVATMASPRWA